MTSLTPTSSKTETLWKPFDSLKDYRAYHRYVWELRDRDYARYLKEFRVAGENDLFFLVNFIMSFGRSDLEALTKKPLYFHPHFLEFCRAIEGMYSSKSVYGVNASARNTCKTQINTIALSIQWALRVDNIAILLLSAERQWAQGILGTISREILTNELLGEIWPHRVWPGKTPKDKVNACNDAGFPWNRDTVSLVRVDGKPGFSRRNHTFETSYFLGGAKVGGGFDLCFADDIERAQSVEHEEARAKAWNHFSEQRSTVRTVVLPREFVYITNTNFHDDGIVGRTSRRAVEMDERAYVRHPAEDLSEPGGCPMGGTARYPWSESRLWDRWNSEITDSNARQHYARQYALDFQYATGFQLDVEGIEFYDETPYERLKKMDEGLYSVVCIDPSSGAEDPQCGLGAVYRGDQRWTLATMSHGHYKPEQLESVWADLIARTNSLAEVWEVRIEDQHGGPFKLIAQRAVLRAGLHCPVVMTRAQPGKRKEERIWAWIAAPVGSGCLEMPRPARPGEPRHLEIQNHDGTFKDGARVLFEEIQAFPSGAHDDAVDALSMFWIPDDQLERWKSRGNPSIHRARERQAFEDWGVAVGADAPRRRKSWMAM